MKPRAAKTITQTLQSIGYELVSVRQLGEDPGTHSIRSIVIGVTDAIYSDSRYAVWSCIDWRTAYDKQARKRGVELCAPVFNLTREDAIGEEGARYMDLMQRYTWIIPGTGKIVPGSRGSRP